MNNLLTLNEKYLFSWRSDQTNYWWSRSWRRRDQMQALHTRAYVPAACYKDYLLHANAKPGSPIRFFDILNLYLQMQAFHSKSMCRLHFKLYSYNFQPPREPNILRISRNNWIRFNSKMLMVQKWEFNPCFRFREHFNKLLICKSSYEEPFLVSNQCINQTEIVYFSVFVLCQT